MFNVKQLHRGALLFLALLCSHICQAQQKFESLQEKVTLTGKNISLVDCIHQLEKQSRRVFTYSSEQLKDIRLGAIRHENEALGTVLSFIESNYPVEISLFRGNISIKLSGPHPEKTLPPGSLKGRIVDFETTQPLPGATITIPALNRTVVSNEKGYYTFSNILPGTYTVIVSYTGYTTATQRVKTDGQTVFDVAMQVSASALREVVISSGKRKVNAVTHSTERELISEIRNATGVISGISNEMISKTGDRNAAEVVKRISGVTVVDDRFIVIRGMNERYNLTLLNNNVAPCTELFSKAFAYDLLPSSIIDKIIVYKSPVADLVADYGGGAVKIYTKNAIPVRHLDIGVQIAHRPGSTLSDINSYTGGKYDFWGFDDGSRKLPSWSPGYFHTEKRAAGISQKNMVESFSNNLDIGPLHSLPDMQVFFNYYNNWKLGGERRLFNLSSVTFTHETKSYDIYRQSGNTNDYGNGSNGFNFGALNKISNVSQTTEIGKINILENLTLRLNKHHTLEFRNFIVNESRKLTSISDSRLNTTYSIDSSGGFRQKRNIVLSFQQRLLYSGNFGGTHSWGATHQQELSWNLGYTHDLQHIPDQRGSHFQSSFGRPFSAAGTNSFSSDDGFLGMISRVFIRNEESIYNASVDYSYHLNKQVQFKAGTYQMYRLRNVGRRFFRVNRAGLPPDFNGSIIGIAPPGWANGFGSGNPSLLNFPQQQLEKVWSPDNFTEDGSGLMLYDATGPTDSYMASEQNNAFYVMGDWKAAHEKITINAGLRMEYDRQKVASANVAFNHILLGYGDHPLTSWLPSVNIGYRPWTTVVLRAGYGRTVNRPEFREISFYQDFDYQNNETYVGDPATVSAVLDNYDFRVEWYPHSAQQNEMFNIGVFHKYIQHPIERLRADQTSDGSSFAAMTYGNALSAKVTGIEAEIRKSLSFIGAGRVFKNLSVVANGAWIKSSTVQVSGNSLQRTRDTAQGRPLQGQSPYIVNTGLFYDNPGWGTKLGIVYNVNGPRIYAKSLYNHRSNARQNELDSMNLRPDLLQLPFHQLDFSITQRIIRSLQMKFTIQNILDQTSRIVEDHHYNQRYDPEKPLTVPGSNNPPNYEGDNIFTSFKPGRYFLLQFTYAF